MSDLPGATSQAAAIPDDDLERDLVLSRPGADAALPHVALAGDTYTILVSGEQSGGAYCLIDMHVPPGGGPPPHRHDFEEMFTVLEGEIEITFRGQRSLARAGDTVNVPANAPHGFKNAGERPARLLCTCSPPGLDEFFMLAGDPVESRTAPAPDLSDVQKAQRKARAEALASRFHTVFIAP